MKINVIRKENYFLNLDIFYQYKGEHVKAQFNKKTNSWIYRKLSRNNSYDDLYLPTQREINYITRIKDKELSQ